jgi:hypothetical protein
MVGLADFEEAKGYKTTHKVAKCKEANMIPY